MSLMVPLSDIKPKVLANYETQVMKCINDTLKICDSDFFILAQHLPKRGTDERGLQTNIVALFGIPTPTFDSTLYKYKKKDDSLDLMWTLPAEEYARNLFHNRDMVHPDEYPLLQQVMQFYDGTLFKIIDEWEQEHGKSLRARESKSRAKRGSKRNYTNRVGSS